LAQSDCVNRSHPIGMVGILRPCGVPHQLGRRRYSLVSR
jgi:hypothetical protein